MAKKPKLSLAMIMAAWRHLPYCSEPKLGPDEFVVFESWDSKGTRGEHAQKFDAFVADQTRLRLALDERLAAGRYTLDDAALLLGSQTKQNPRPLVELMLESAASGSLKIYPPGSCVHETNPPIRYFYHEAYWDDLNTWVTAELPRLSWRFPNPDKGQSESAKSKSKGNEKKWTAADAERMKREVAQEKAKGTKAYAKVVATRNGISSARMRQIIQSHAPRPSGAKDSIAQIATARPRY